MRRNTSDQGSWNTHTAGERSRFWISGVVTSPAGPRGGEQLHNTRVRQFAVTVYGEIDVEASDGTRAHLRTGDMSFIEDVAGKGHRTFETGSQSVFLQVPEGFDVKTWAAGQ